MNAPVSRNIEDFRREAWRPPAGSAPTPSRRTWAAAAQTPFPTAQMGMTSLRQGLRLLPALAALGVAALALALILHAAGFGETGPSSLIAETLPFANANESTPTSTPKGQWTKGVVPHLYQTDMAWAAQPYAEGTIGDSGCGPTSLAMVYVALTGRTDRDPASLCQFSEQGGYVEEGLTAWRLMTDGAHELGLSSEVIPADANVMAREVRSGHPLILSMAPGDFTQTGHFIVVSGVAENGDFIVNDPNSEANSAKTWNPQRLLAQCRNIWAFSRR